MKAHPKPKKSKLTETIEVQTKYACEICGRKFNRNGLGGHMSRAHPNKSKKFKKKKATKNARKGKLAILRKAQAIYRERYERPDIKNIEMDRNKLLAIKEEVAKLKLVDVTDLDYSEE